MTTIMTHSVTTPLSAPQTHTVTFSDYDFQNILNYLAVRYTPNGGVPPPPDQCLLMWLEEAVSTMLTQVHSWQVAQQASSGPPPITPAVS